MIDQIKNNAKKISRLNMIVGFCLGMFVFMVRENSASAKETIQTPNYSSTSMTEFITQVSSKILFQNIEQAKQKYNSNFDIISDYSLQKYISDELLLQNKRYTPSDLVQIDSEYIVNRAGRPYLRQPAQIAFEKMAKEFNQQLDRQFYLISAYRSYRDQATLFEGGCSTNRCAKIGGSEHQLGLAVDIHLATYNGYDKLVDEYLERLNNNAYQYGFINTYSKGVDIDGKMKEVWHWRYVGVPLATKLYRQGLSFAEYYKYKMNLSKV